ncbi:MAG: Asd/ArgC dimerization domain-containing protein, partial [Limisphaerales bacterium]
EEIKNARLIANPGCYPTSILLPIIPLIREGIIKTTGIIANSMSAVTGAGRKLDTPYLFGEVNESVRPYGVPKHRHLSEIEQELSIAANDDVIIQFSPHLLPINRGIQSTLYLAPAKFFASDAEAEAISEAVAAAYEKHYADDVFVRILGTKGLPDTKNVAFTNFVEIAWRLDPRTGRLLVFSAEDNIVKGASGQAIQNFNVLIGCPEESGL